MAASSSGLLIALGAGLLPSSAAVGAQTPRCATSKLRLSVVQRTAGAGRRFWDLALRNAGGARCRLSGYPGVGLLDSRGRLIHVNVERQTGVPVRGVTLLQGRRAYFTFAYEDSGPCLPHFFSAYGVQVFPPGATTRLFLHSARFDICAPSVGGRPAVGPVRATLE